MFKQCKSAAVALPILGILLTCACGTQPSHPNQLNAFDGATYDTLLLAHGALTSLEATTSVSYPKYTPMFNQAAAAFNTASTTYASFRTTPATQAEVAVTITNLTVAIVALEDAFQTDMQPSASTIAQIRAHAKLLRHSAAQAGLSVSDLLTELEIAAAVARTIAQASPYAQVAQIVIQTTAAALAAELSQVGLPIDMSLIPPIPALH
jgi:hypothetical protein